jgi:hypothetical protein
MASKRRNLEFIDFNMRGLLFIGWGPVIFIANIGAGNTQSHCVLHVSIFVAQYRQGCIFDIDAIAGEGIAA